MRHLVTRRVSKAGPCAVTALSLLSLAGALAAPSAQAQSLTLNNATGIISGSGTSVGGGYTFGGGAGPATTRYSTVDTTPESTVSLQSGGSIDVLTLNTDNSHEFISTTNAYINGGSVTSLVVGDFGSAGFSITGGSVGSIALGYSGDGHGTISGGTVGDVSDSGGLQVSGGTVGNVIEPNDFTGLGGIADVSGGNVKSITSQGGGTDVSGGSVGSLNLETGYYGDGGYYGTNATISGGVVGPVSAIGAVEDDFGYYSDIYTTCDIRGGAVGTLTAATYGGYDVFGTDLRLSPAGYVTGFLSDGQAIDTHYTNTDGNGFLKFNGAPVPEASSVVSFGLLLALGLGGLAAAKRQARAAEQAEPTRAFRRP